MTIDDDTRRRIETLENAVRRLLSEVADLQRELGGQRPSTPPRPSTPDPQLASFPNPRPSTRNPQPASSLSQRSSMNIEELVGRYGAMGLAALAIISAVGIFLRWAIERGLLVPEVRVAAGFLSALALAGIGWRFRTRGARVFGNTLLGIALATVHVVAWAAGPLLQVVPVSVALAGAAMASIALASLAWRSGEESLFVIGIGGAILAPFVTSGGSGNGLSLLIYGWILLSAAAGGMRDRPWRVARWLLGAGTFLYAGAAMTGAWSIGGDWGKEAPAIFAIACAWGALGWAGAIHGPALVRSQVAAALPPLLYVFDQESLFASHLIVAGAATVTVWAAVHRREEPGVSWVVGAFMLPLAFLFAALLPLADAFSASGALAALGWGGGAVVAGYLAPGARREVHWTVAAVATGIALLLWLRERELTLIWALSLHAVAVSLVMRRERAALLAVPAAIALAGAALLTWNEFAVRAPFAYTPFLTRPSAAALAVVIGAAVLGWSAAQTEWSFGNLPALDRGRLKSLGLIAAFLWIRAELAEAWSSDLSTFLLIGYYATAGVAAILFARRRQLTDLRRVGLALAIYAALKAVGQAYALGSIGLRVGTFLLVGAFLLAVAYVYRGSDGAGSYRPADG